jgi:photosystem II stability/assembly factor-like uncharacterized protein
MKHLVLAVSALGGLFTAVTPAVAQSWTLTSAPNLPWTSIASSADGSQLVAGSRILYAQSGYIFTSRDAGATWAGSIAPDLSWSAVASSADGTKLVAVAFGDTSGEPTQLYISNDSGTTWAAPTNSPARIWTSVASSADGAKLVAAGYCNCFDTGGFGPWRLRRMVSNW